MLRVCVYDADPGADPVGQFTSGRTLTGDAATALSDALHRAGPAIDCSTPHSRFAVVTLERADQWAVAALDGCRRLLRPDNNTLVSSTRTPSPCCSDKSRPAVCGPPRSDRSP